MGSEWPIYPLEQCMDAIIDYRGKTPRKTASGIPLITAKIIKNGRILPVHEYIAVDEYDSWMRRGLPMKGDVLLTTEAPLGEVAQLDGRKVALAQRLIALRGKNGFLDNTFLKYQLQSHEIQHQLQGRASGTTVSGIKQSELRKVILSVPPMLEQRAIAHILGTLDDKIELNRRMNETLEAMAQTLFKSWFVDFDPVIDNALAAGNPIPEEIQPRAAVRESLGDARKPLPDNIRDLFPSEFESTDEMGWIPKGWAISQIGDLLELAYGKALAAKIREPGPFPVYGSGGITGCHNEAMVKGPGIIVGRKGTVGSVYWESDDFFPIDTVFFVRLKNDMPFYWVYQNLMHMDIASLGADSAVPGVNRNAILAKKWVLPSEKVLDTYWTQLQPFTQKQQNQSEQSKTLELLRNTLLPKLLAGELRIPEAVKRVEAGI